MRLTFSTLLNGKQKSAPVGHHLPAALKRITPPVGSLDLVLDGVCQRHFSNLSRVACLFASPVSKGGSKSMWNSVNTHTPHQLS
jgi:hypothetical protein